jgi:hypothetical protein
MLARRVALGADRFRHVVEASVQEGQHEDSFKAVVAQNKVEAYASTVSELEAKRDRVAQGAAWVATNMPASDDKDALVEAIQTGLESIDAHLSFFRSEHDEAQAILDELES